MIQPITKVSIIDNSNVRLVKCIKIYGQKSKAIGKVNCLFLGVVISTKKANTKKVYKKGDLVYCILIQSKTNTLNFKKSGIYIKNININGAVVMTKSSKIFEYKNSRTFSFLFHSTKLKYPQIYNFSQNAI